MLGTSVPFLENNTIGNGNEKYIFCWWEPEMRLKEDLMSQKSNHYKGECGTLASICASSLPEYPLGELKFGSGLVLNIC